jgi:hypothetical protein
MTGEEIREVARLEAPYGRQVLLQDVVHESGLKLLRIRIREGSRFTILDVDAPTAKSWGEEMLAWAEAAAETG